MEEQQSRLRASVDRVRGHLRRRLVVAVRAVVDDVVGTAGPPAPDRVSDLDRKVFRTSQITSGVELQLRAISEQLAPPSGPFDVDMTMAGVLRRHESAALVLASVGLPGCGGCAVRHDETLGEAIDGYGFDGPELLARLNALLEPGDPALHALPPRG